MLGYIFRDPLLIKNSCAWTTLSPEIIILCIFLLILIFSKNFRVPGTHSLNIKKAVSKLGQEFKKFWIVSSYSFLVKLVGSPKITHLSVRFSCSSVYLIKNYLILLLDTVCIKFLPRARHLLLGKL